MIRLLTLAAVLASLSPLAAHSQSKTEKPKIRKKPAPFQWVNPLPVSARYPNLTHGTFKSPSMKVDVGYCIYLPNAYKSNDHDRFPVVYYLHGGRPGSERKSISLVHMIHQNFESQNIPPMIYVFVNGGPVSHYNVPEIKNGLGEDVFIKELIPHIDQTYRTIADRKSRAIEGFSQGGRGTARIMFKHPKLFCSAAPGGGGYATEKSISENGGRENERLKFAEGYNTWDLAKAYSKSPSPPLSILVHVGDKGFNYENNLAYMDYLASLGISHQKIIVPGVPHSAKLIYEKRGVDLMKFHAKSFGLLKD